MSGIRYMVAGQIEKLDGQQLSRKDGMSRCPTCNCYYSSAHCPACQASATAPQASAKATSTAPQVPDERAALVRSLTYSFGERGAALLDSVANSAVDPVKFLRDVKAAAALRNVTAAKVDESAITDSDRAEFTRCGVTDEAQMIEIKRSMLAARQKTAQR